MSFRYQFPSDEDCTSIKHTDQGDTSFLFEKESSLGHLSDVSELVVVDIFFLNIV